MEGLTLDFSVKSNVVAANLGSIAKGGIFTNGKLENQIAAVAVCICLFAHVSSYFHILLWGCVFVAVYAFFLWFFGLNKFERDLVAVPASKIWRRIRRR